MADLLTHVLVPYVLLTVARWGVGFSRRWVPVAMGGAAIPDLVKVGLVVDESVVQELLGVPFGYGPVSSVGGVLVIGIGITVLFERAVWPRVYGALLFGGATSLVLDGLRVYVDGGAGFWLYPVFVRPPTPNLYVTSDPRVLVVALVFVVCVTAVDQRTRIGQE